MSGTLEQRGGICRPIFFGWLWIPQRALPALRYWSLPLGLLALATALQVTGLQNALRYDRIQIDAGQWWRLLTANLVHLGWMHLLLDGAALVLVWLLLGHRFRIWQWLLIAGLSMLGVGAGLYLFDPRLVTYVGLSGMLHGLYAAGTVALARRDKPLALICALLLAGKLAWEQCCGPDPFTAELIGGAIVVNAHLYGAITGLIAGWVLTRHGNNRRIAHTR